MYDVAILTTAKMIITKTKVLAVRRGNDNMVQCVPLVKNITYFSSVEHS